MGNRDLKEVIQNLNERVDTQSETLRGLGEIVQSLKNKLAALGFTCALCNQYPPGILTISAVGLNWLILAPKDVCRSCADAITDAAKSKSKSKSK